MGKTSVLLVLLALSACATTAPRAASPGAAGEVDYRCRTGADCEVKNVGNCCGYYPACVNRDSPTFPDRVKAECAGKNMMGVCGFPAVAACACVEGRCTDKASAAHER